MNKTLTGFDTPQASLYRATATAAINPSNMFKYAVVIFAVIACAAAKPGLIGAPLAYAAPAAVVAAPAPVVTATSSQVIARNYNGIAHAPIVATAPVAAPLAVAPAVARVAAPLAAPLAVTRAAYAAPVVARYAAAPAPLAYAAPLAARYVSSPYVSSPYAAAYAHSYAAPLRYASSSLLL